MQKKNNTMGRKLLLSLFLGTLFLGANAQTDSIYSLSDKGVNIDKIRLVFVDWKRKPQGYLSKKDLLNNNINQVNEKTIRGEDTIRAFSNALSIVNAKEVDFIENDMRLVVEFYTAEDILCSFTVSRLRYIFWNDTVFKNNKFILLIYKFVPEMGTPW